MKKSITLLFLALIANITSAQIDNNLTNPNWKPTKEKIIYGSTILRIEGLNDIGGITNIGYQNLENAKAVIEKDAEAQMWTSEKKNKTIERYTNSAPGGLIHLYLSRLTIDAANTEMFTIIIKDSSEKEIYRKELNKKIASVPERGSNYWTNYAIIPVGENLKGKIFIYVIDKLDNDNGKFKFEINL